MDDDLIDDFHIAAQAGDVQLVQRMLELFPELAAATDETGGNALHSAAMFLHAPVIELLLRAGMAPALPDAAGRTPLSTAALCAAREEDAATVRLLLEAAPAAALMAESSGWTPLHQAACNAHPATVQLLLEAAPEAAQRPNSQGNMPIHVAVQRLRRASASGSQRHHALEVARCITRCAACDTLSLVAALSRVHLRWGAHVLHAELVESRPLTPAQWQQLPSPCAARLLCVLPAVLERSEEEAGQLVAHLRRTDRQRLRTRLKGAALVLARVTAPSSGAHLPPDVRRCIARLWLQLDCPGW